ncbi:MAG: ATP-grasp domain-containing protein [Methanomicrobiales archaeon]
MNLLFFEFATATGSKDPSISSEGLAMLEGLLTDLKGFNYYYLLSKQSNSYIDIINNYNQSKGLNPILFNCNLEKWLDNNINKFDSCLFIAPEEDNVLYNLTKLIENKGVNVIGSDSNAVKVCSNKLETYDKLKNIVPIIKTEKVLFEEINNYERFNKEFQENNKKIIKPVDGVSCSGVYVVRSYKELKTFASLIKTNYPYFVMQDQVKGLPCSVSLLSDGINAIPLSLNAQDISIINKCEYKGGHIPLNHAMSTKAKKIAKETVEALPGIRGYVGVDLILDDEVYVVEVNSRITTPYIGLRKIINFNLAKSIINSVKGILPVNISLEGKVSFKKKGNQIYIDEN